MENLNKYVLEKAVQNNICDEWAEKIQTADIRVLLDLYVKGIDFCLSNDFPNNKDIKRLFGDLINEYGIYLDASGEFTDRSFLVLLGQCTADITCAGFTVSQVFIKHKSQCDIVVKDNSFVVIDCFDDTDITVLVKDNAKALINVYGKARLTSNSEGRGMVKVIHKHKKTY